MTTEDKQKKLDELRREWVKASLKDRAIIERRAKCLLKYAKNNSL